MDYIIREYTQSRRIELQTEIKKELTLLHNYVKDDVFPNQKKQIINYLKNTINSIISYLMLHSGI